MEDAWWGSPEVFVVADGNGGNAGAKSAALAAVDAVAAAAPGTAPCQVIRAADLAVARVASLDMLAGAGCCMVVAVISGGELFIASVGDCRAYLIGPRSPAARRLTTDDRLASGSLARRVGSGRLEALEDRQVLANPGDRLLLVTDGVHDCMNDLEIGTLLMGSAPNDPELAARHLVLAAHAAAASAGHVPDDASALMVDLVEDIPDGLELRWANGRRFLKPGDRITFGRGGTELPDVPHVPLSSSGLCSRQAACFEHDGTYWTAIAGGSNTLRLAAPGGYEHVQFRGDPPARLAGGRTTTVEIRSGQMLGSISARPVRAVAYEALPGDVTDTWSPEVPLSAGELRTAVALCESRLRNQEPRDTPDDAVLSKRLSCSTRSAENSMRSIREKFEAKFPGVLKYPNGRLISSWREILADRLVSTSSVLPHHLSLL